MGEADAVAAGAKAKNCKINWFLVASIAIVVVTVVIIILVI